MFDVQVVTTNECFHAKEKSETICSQSVHVLNTQYHISKYQNNKDKKKVYIKS